MVALGASQPDRRRPNQRDHASATPGVQGDGLTIIDPSNAGFSPSELGRRQFQQAVAVTLDRQAAALSATREFMADLSVRIDELKAQVTADKVDAVALAADYATFKQQDRELRKRHALDHYVSSEAADARAASCRIATEPLRRPFLGRLRWLLTGK